MAFRRDELDADRHRQAILHLAEQLGFRLRGQGNICRRLALTVHYADQSTTQRSRVLAEPSSHTPAWARTAREIYTALGLQRARVRGFVLRAEGLCPADAAHHQLTFDPTDERARVLEAVADRARHHFGASVIRPAALAGKPAAAHRTVRPRT